MSDVSLTEQIERAFDYRGHVTVSRHDGTTLIGFVYDRGPTHVEMYDEHAVDRIRVPIADISSVALTGDDSAAKAHELWERRRGSLEPATTSAWGEWGDWEDRPALLVVALPMELHGVAAALGGTVRTDAARGWFGDRRAVAVAVGLGRGAAYAIAAERPRLVISCGFSGGLDRSLRAGDLVLATTVCDETGDCIRGSESVLRVARQALGGQVRVCEGEILCATRVAATREEKRALVRPGRRAIDLESWAVARAARQAGIPWLALRVVFDPLDVDLPAFTREIRNNYVAPAMRYALGGPHCALDLARLFQRARTANRSLGRALRYLGPALRDLGPEATS